MDFNRKLHVEFCECRISFYEILKELVKFGKEHISKVKQIDKRLWPISMGIE